MTIAQPQSFLPPFPLFGAHFFARYKRNVKLA